MDELLTYWAIRAADIRFWFPGEGEPRWPTLEELQHVEGIPKWTREEMIDLVRETFGDKVEFIHL